MGNPGITVHVYPKRCPLSIIFLWMGTQESFLRNHGISFTLVKLLKKNLRSVGSYPWKNYPKWKPSFSGVHYTNSGNSSPRQIVFCVQWKTSPPNQVLQVTYRSAKVLNTIKCTPGKGGSLKCDHDCVNISTKICEHILAMAQTA